MLSPSEAASAVHGQAFKRYIRAAAAMQGIYDDVALSDAVQVHRRTVAGWWLGAKPSPETLRHLADATGLAVDELSRFVYYDGPPPHLPDDPDEAAVAARTEAADEALRALEGSGSPATPPAPRETTGSGRSRP